MSEADVLVAEVMPLLSACRFMEKHASRVLAPRRPAGGPPVWLRGTRILVRRLPFGAVLILAPSNYPLFLPGAQAVQAIVAGNGVMVKPAPGAAGPMLFLGDALRRSGLPEGLFAVLPDSHTTGTQALRVGADKVVLTGGYETGRRVLRELAETVTPSIMELSGDDALVVLPGASIDVVARAIIYGLTLNGGRTCIAPRRIIAIGETGRALADRLEVLLAQLPLLQVDADEAGRLREALTASELAGGRVIGGRGQGAEAMIGPVIALAPEPAACLPPLFGPAASLLVVADVDAAVAVANAGVHALGASVFGPEATAQAVARRLCAGCVSVNGVVVPTADPRLPFGGAGASGFGATRGAEGLLEMTRPQAVVSRRRAYALQYRLLPSSAAPWIARGLRLLYG
jgi:acyl-CoA reductase-like NAD-dependent aldehyde dehydrogenase